MGSQEALVLRCEGTHGRLHGARPVLRRGALRASPATCSRLAPPSDNAGAPCRQWLEYKEPCPLSPGQAAQEACVAINFEDTQSCAGADLSGDAAASKQACEGVGVAGSLPTCSSYPCCTYFDPDAGCVYSMLSDESWLTSASSMNWDAITPEQHPGNYILAVAYYAVWLVVQAILSLIGAVASCCCLRKKQMDEQPAPAVMWASRGILGLLLLATMFMANTMELFGNRNLNDSIHNAIHSVEGLFNYADDWIGPAGVGSQLLDVGDRVYAQLGVVRSTIFDNADPVALEEAATCMQDIGNTCVPPDYDGLMSQYFAWAGDGDGPEGSPPSMGKCDITSYIEGQDYVLGATLAESDNVILDALPAQGQCAIFCLVGQSGCTGAQWTTQDDLSEVGCVLWLNDKCSTGSAAPGYTAGDAASSTIDVVYKRVPTSVPASETECVQDKTVATVNGIYVNVIALPVEIMDIINVMDVMMDNEVSICLLDGLATPLGDGLAELVPTIEGLQESLDGLLASLRDGIQGGREALDKADDGYEILKGAPTGDEWGVWHTKTGEDYPPKTVTDPPTPAECSGGLSCVLNYDETACQASDTDNCVFTAPVTDPQPYEVEDSCHKLACIDNTVNYYDENRGGDLPIARTQLFSIFSITAMVGSALGLIGLAMNKVLLWKLMCFLFFLWGPASLILSGVAHPPMIFASDACQDIEEVAIDVALAQRPEWAATGTITLIESSEIMEFLNNVPNFNYTGAPIEDVTTESMPDLIRYYLTEDCQGPAGAGIATTLDTMEQIIIDVVQSMADNAGDMVEQMAAQMGDSGMELRQGVVDEITAVTQIVGQDVPPAISRAFGLLGCGRISRAYYEVKSPICCDVVVALYWIACAFPVPPRLLMA